MELGVLQDSGSNQLDELPQSHTLDEFFVSIEKKAYRMAHLAVHNDADALDIVQDAMIKLSVNYGDRPSNEWKPLFYRILENRIMDFHRKETVRKKWFFWKTDNKGNGLDDEDDVPPIEQEDESTDPFRCLNKEELSEGLLRAIEGLPIKQQQCFLLRCWEGLSVKETAEAMGVNEGSVKTHHYRAMQKLQVIIEEYENEHQ